MYLECSNNKFLYCGCPYLTQLGVVTAHSNDTICTMIILQWEKALSIWGLTRWIYNMRSKVFNSSIIQFFYRNFTKYRRRRKLFYEMVIQMFRWVKNIQEHFHEYMHCVSTWIWINTNVNTYVYFKIPSNLFVHMMTHLSALPDANLLPSKCMIIPIISSALGSNRPFHPTTTWMWGWGATCQKRVPPASLTSK